MTTDYTHTVTIAAPASWINDASHLALLLGESAADIETFKQTSYTDGTTDYAVAHTVVKAVFLAPTQTGQLPETPPHAKKLVDREAAQRAFDSMSQPSGIRLSVDVDPHAQFKQWGLSRIKTEEAV